MATQVPVAEVPPGIYIGPTGQALVVTQQAGATYTFALADEGTVVESTNATGATFTIPLNSTVGFGIPTEITALDGPGTGVLTVTGAAGVTLNGVSGGSVATTGAYQAITLIQTAANVWVGATSSAGGSYLPLAGGTMTGAQSFANKTTPQEYWVSLGSLASDSNSGDKDAPFLTLTHALNVANGTGESYCIHLGYGAFIISAADAYGNGGTINVVGSSIVGLDYMSVVEVAANVTFGLVCWRGVCSIKDLLLVSSTGFTATYGVGVDTPTSVGSSESCFFQNVEVASGSGTVVNAFAVGPTHTGVGTVDIAETDFMHCSAQEYTNAGFYVGNGTVANILNTRMTHCTAESSSGIYGVYCNASMFTWYGGTTQGNVTDFYTTAVNGLVLVSGVRSEGSTMLWQCVGGGGNQIVTLANINWVGSDIVSTGIFILHAAAGTLILDNITVPESAHNPVIELGGGGGSNLICHLRGVQTATPIGSLFDFGTSAKAIVESYIQLPVGGGNGLAVASITGPITFAVRGNHGVYAADWTTLTASGAVVISGDLPFALIAMNGYNATSSTITNAYYLGQKLTICWQHNGAETYVWPTNCKFAGNLAPVDPGTASTETFVNFIYDGTNWAEKSRAVAVPL